MNHEGEPYQHKNYLGDAVTTWRDKLKLRKELRLDNTCGTAATRLLEPGAELKEIATHMAGPSSTRPRFIERYVALSQGMTDGLAEKLEEAERRTKL
ncbi:hypothetical protein [Falsirhodobacter sp. 20TX0035]|uniref:hypothetical protein n=1 Tax=Falsirhodobacter sp. 20TX0035 TaxID=3022019 RepID=UPI0023307C59|nr:hypothetical protein [Falsirhodobacter sp. 20TX0035]MDB6454450.1 hypothetical protein [Falsirhodobacter sp. 20TX0035]